MVSDFGTYWLSYDGKVFLKREECERYERENPSRENYLAQLYRKLYECERSIHMHKTCENWYMYHSAHSAGKRHAEHLKMLYSIKRKRGERYIDFIHRKGCEAASVREWRGKEIDAVKDLCNRRIERRRLIREIAKVKVDIELAKSKVKGEDK